MPEAQHPIPARVLIADDSAFMRRALAAVIETDGSLELIGEASDGPDALCACQEHRPDVLLLDTLMPGLDGPQVLGELVRSGFDAIRVIACSTAAPESVAAAIAALRIGAADLVAKPTTTRGLAGSAEARLLLDAVARSLRPRDPGPATTGPDSAAHHAQPDRPPSCIVVNAAPNDLPELRALLDALPAGLGIPVIVALPMPLGFSAPFAAALDADTTATVLHAESRMPLIGGTVVVAQGGRHLGLSRDPSGRICLEFPAEPEEILRKPDLGLLRRSAETLFGADVLSVSLPGAAGDAGASARPIADLAAALSACAPTHRSKAGRSDHAA